MVTLQISLNISSSVLRLVLVVLTVGEPILCQTYSTLTCYTCNGDLQYEWLSIVNFKKTRKLKYTAISTCRGPHVTYSYVMLHVHDSNAAIYGGVSFDVIVLRVAEQAQNKLH